VPVVVATSEVSRPLLKDLLVWFDEVLLSEPTLLDRKSAAFFAVINNLSY
jgi:hypothetical protein